MDIRALERRAATALARPSSSSMTSGSLFASRLSGAAAPTSAGVEGTRVSPPPGGCACDAMVATANPSVPARPMPSVSEVPGLPVSPSPASVRPGDLLVLDAGAGQSDRVHLAIARTTNEMLAPDASGLVTAQPIPWNQVRAIRRPA